MLSRKRNLRRKHFTDRAVQGSLILHVVGNWLVFLFTVAVFLLLIEMCTRSPYDALQAAIHRHAPSLWAVVLLAPIFLWDLVKLSHRFAGPMVRLRREMRNLAEGRTVGPLHFRAGDFWKDMAADFNRVVERVQALDAAVCRVQPAERRDDDGSREDTTPELARS
jgi:hypothetical protein